MKAKQLFFVSYYSNALWLCEIQSYQWILYREEVSACPEGEMELEFTLEFDGSNHRSDNRVVIYKGGGPETGEIIFDSDIDHDDSLVNLQDVMAVVRTWMTP